MTLSSSGTRTFTTLITLLKLCTNSIKRTVSLTSDISLCSCIWRSQRNLIRSLSRTKMDSSTASMSIPLSKSGRNPTRLWTSGQSIFSSWGLSSRSLRKEVSKYRRSSNTSFRRSRRKTRPLTQASGKQPIGSYSRCCLLASSWRTILSRATHS